MGRRCLFAAKYLGLHFADMSWNTMTSHVARRVAAKIGLLNEVQHVCLFLAVFSFSGTALYYQNLNASAAYAPFIVLSE